MGRSLGSLACSALVVLTLCSSASHQSAPRIKEVVAIAEEAYFYGLPVIAAYTRVSLPK